jgi:hypothetical protein
MKGNNLICITLALMLSLLFVPVVFAYENFCFEFKAANNDTKVVAKHSDSLNITGELTMEAWIYPTEVLGQAIIVNKEDSWEIELQNLVLKAAINSARWAWEGGGNVELNKWSHVAATFDTKEHHTFVNGKYQVSTSIPGNIKPSTQNFHVGWRPC